MVCTCDASEFQAVPKSLSCLLLSAPVWSSCELLANLVVKMCREQQEEILRSPCTLTKGERWSTFCKMWPLNETTRGDVRLWRVLEPCSRMLWDSPCIRLTCKYCPNNVSACKLAVCGQLFWPQDTKDVWYVVKSRSLSEEVWRNTCSRHVGAFIWNRNDELSLKGKDEANILSFCEEQQCVKDLWDWWSLISACRSDGTHFQVFMAIVFFFAHTDEPV